MPTEGGCGADGSGGCSCCYRDQGPSLLGRSARPGPRPREGRAGVNGGGWDDRGNWSLGNNTPSTQIKTHSKLIVALPLHEHLLRLVDLGRQEGRAPEVGVVDARHAPVRVLDPFRGRRLAHAEDQGGLPPRHRRLEGALVVAPARAVEPRREARLLAVLFFEVRGSACAPRRPSPRPRARPSGTPRPGPRGGRRPCTRCRRPRRRCPLPPGPSCCRAARVVWGAASLLPRVVLRHALQHGAAW